MKIHFKYRKTWWWHFVHYNYFHRRLFKKFYVRKKHSEAEIRKYHIFQFIDDLITLRSCKWLRVFIWKLDWKLNTAESEDPPKKIMMTSNEYYKLNEKE